MPSLEETLEIVEDQATSDLRTALPAKVVEYDHDVQKAKVDPIVDASFIEPESGERETKSMPQIPGVPVAFPSAGDVQVTYPLSEGDTVLVLWSERSLDEWLATAADSTQPSDNRRHDVTDAMAIPALRSFANAIEATTDDYVVNVENGKEVHLGNPNPAQYVALAGDVKSELEELRTAINDLIDTYNPHVHLHPVPSTPAGVVPTQQTTSTDATKKSSIDDISADKVKAD
jgi:hypothetical protein